MTNAVVPPSEIGGLVDFSSSALSLILFCFPPFKLDGNAEGDHITSTTYSTSITARHRFSKTRITATQRAFAIYNFRLRLFIDRTRQ